MRFLSELVAASEVGARSGGPESPTLPHVLVLLVFSLQRRSGDPHSWRDAVRIAHSDLHAVQIRAMQASDCFITVISFGIVNEGASFVNEELHTVDRPHVVKHVAEDGLRQWVHQVPHPHWKQLLFSPALHCLVRNDLLLTLDVGHILD